MPAKTYECYLNYGCNQRCVFCFVSERDRARGNLLSPAALSRNLYRMRREGCSELSLLGGEPALHPHAVRLCALARKLGYRRVFIFTNGTRFSDAGFARKMAAAGLTAAYVSAHSHLPAVHDRVTRVKGSHAKMLAGLDNLRAAGAGVVLVCVVTGYNAASLPAYARFYLDRGVRNFTVFFTKHQGRLLDDSAGAKAAFIPMSRAAAAVRKMFGVFRDRGEMPPKLEHFTPCVLKGYESRMTDHYPGGLPGADAGYCVHPDNRDLPRVETSNKDKFHPAACARCVYRAGCAGVEKTYAERFGVGEFKAVRKFPKPFYAGWPAALRRRLAAGEGFQGE